MVDPLPTADQEPVLLIDGVCNLCNRSVQFVLKRERRAVLRFASLQSDAARSLLADHAIDVPHLSSIVLIQDGKAYVRSSAVLHAARHLRAPWRWLWVLRIVPRPIRDWVYARIAKLRYRVFGKSEACPIPNPSQQARFLDIEERKLGLG